MSDHLGEIWSRTLEHLRLTFLAVAIGLAISMALALVARRWRVTYGPITWLSGVLYTIPSLALFALLTPLTHLTTTTVEIALVSYTLLVLVRNIVAGFDAVPADVKEAAAGMGMSRGQQLRRVELPLAVPYIVTGVRIATVTTVGLTSISSLLGDNLGGLGHFIDDGINRLFNTPIVVGSVLSVALAAVLDLAILAAARVLTPWTRRRAT